MAPNASVRRVQLGRDMELHCFTALHENVCLGSRTAPALPSLNSPHPPENACTPSGWRTSLQRPSVWTRKRAAGDANDWWLCGLAVVLGYRQRDLQRGLPNGQRVHHCPVRKLVWCDLTAAIAPALTPWEASPNPTATPVNNNIQAYPFISVPVVVRARGPPAPQIRGGAELGSGDVPLRTALHQDQSAASSMCLTLGSFVSSDVGYGCNVSEFEIGFGPAHAAGQFSVLRPSPPRAIGTRSRR